MLKNILACACVSAAALLAGCHPGPPPQLPYDFNKGEDVIQAMHDRYFGRWPENLTMAQHNTDSSNPADTTLSIWLTAVQPPYRMRIDYVPREAYNGVLILRDTQYVITNARATQVSRFIDPVFLLQHAVYFLTPSETVARLREAGVNTDRVAQNTWDGRAMWVLGEAPAAQGGRQVWIDKDLYLLVRVLEPSARDRTMVVETRLLQYEPMNSVYVPRVVAHYEDGRQVRMQQNREIRANQRLDSLLFFPDTWREARHWYQQSLIR